MTVTISESSRFSPTVWRVVFSSGLPDPTFYLYLDGSFVTATQDTEWEFDVAEGDSPVVDIFDDPDTAPEYARSGRLVLCWEGVSDTASYLVEEWVVDTWVERGSVLATTAAWYVFRTRYLEDSTTHLHRVTPIGVNGNTGTSVEFSTLLVRVPDVPAVEFAYDPNTGKMTAAAG